jgi:hypothetical protein
VIAESHNILNRWQNKFCRLLNARGVNYVRQTEVDTGEPLIYEFSSSDIEIDTENLKSYNSSDVDQILAELIQAGRNRLSLEIHKRINSIWNKEEFPQQWKE